jgi:hypothetical protein
MHGMFISYRRHDSAGHTGRLFDRLRAALGPNRVFMDITGIEAGVDFVDTIEQAIGSCELLLVVIGPQWLMSADANGRPRLQDPGDFIRVEIGVALKRKVRVIPVLVGGASMPLADALPDDLKGLTRRQAVELRDSRWDADTNDLIAVLERVLGPQPTDQAAAQDTTVRRAKAGYWKWAAAALVLVLAAIAAWNVSSRSSRAGSPPTGPDSEAKPTTQSEAADPAAPNSSPAPDTAPGKPRATTPPAIKKPPVPDTPPISAPTSIVPNVIGFDLRSARTAIEDAGFVMSPPQYRLSVKARPGEVISQNPAAGIRLKKGDDVAIVYATRGVPDVVGLRLTDAIARLESSGFEVNVEPSDAPDGSIVRGQSQSAGLESRTPLVTVTVDVPAPNTRRPPPVVSPTRGSPTVVVHYSDTSEKLADQRFAEQFVSYISNVMRMNGRIERAPTRGELVTDRKSPNGVVIYYSVEHEGLARRIAQETVAFRLPVMSTGYVDRRSSDVIDVWLPPMLHGR